MAPSVVSDVYMDLTRSRFTLENNPVYNKPVYCLFKSLVSKSAFIWLVKLWKPLPTQCFGDKKVKKPPQAYFVKKHWHSHENVYVAIKNASMKTIHVSIKNNNISMIKTLH